MPIAYSTQAVVQEHSPTVFTSPHILELGQKNTKQAQKIRKGGTKKTQRKPALNTKKRFSNFISALKLGHVLECNNKVRLRQN